MVAEQQNPVIQPRRLQTGDQRSRQTAVQPFDRLQLARQVPVMGTLIRGLQMEADEVVLPELGPGGLQLSLEIGVQLAGSALHLHHLQTPQGSDAVAQGHGAHHRAIQTVLLPERGQRRRRALCPEPDAVGGKQARRPPLFRRRMMVQYLMGQSHETGEDRRPLVPCREQGTAGLSKMIVGRSEANTGDVAVMLDCQLPESGERVNVHPRFFQRLGKTGVVQQESHGLQS